MNTPTQPLEKESPPKRVEDALDPFVSTINDAELEWLQCLIHPALVTKITPEFNHLRNLGLIFIDSKTGFAQVTPLGKAWLLSQDRAGYD